VQRRVKRAFRPLYPQTLFVTWSAVLGRLGFRALSFFPDAAMAELVDALA
jgi:hypothetical protein